MKELAKMNTGTGTEYAEASPQSTGRADAGASMRENGAGMAAEAGLMAGTQENPGALAAGNGGRLLTLADYEARIYLYKEQIGTGYIGIGRTLIEAKEAGAVPHGEWEEWVTRVTGLTARQAQRCMQAAREIREGSAMARLEMSKALMLLQSGLGTEEQEAVAAQAAEESQSIRELKEEIRKIQAKKEADLADARDVIRKLKGQIVRETGAATEMKEQLKKAREERDNLAGQLKDTAQAFNVRLNNAEEAAYNRGVRNTEKEARDEIRKEYENRMSFLKGKKEELDATVADLQGRLEQREKESGTRWDEGFEAGKAESAASGREALDRQQAEIDHLQEALKASEESLQARAGELDATMARLQEMEAELEAAEKREAKRAEELARMKKEKASERMDAARGIGGSVMGAVDLAAAVRSFIGAAGVLPQMGNLVSGMTEKEREQIRAQIETIAQWVNGSRKALGMVMAEGRVD